MVTRTPPRRRAGGLTAVVLLAGLALPSASAPAAGEPATTAERQDEVSRRRAELAASIDVVAADRSEVRVALDILEADVAAHRVRLDTAIDDAEQARAYALQARSDEVRAESARRSLDAAVQRLAVDAFMGRDRGAADIIRFMRSADVAEAARIGFLAGHEVARQDAIATELARVERTAERAHADAERATVEAVRSVEEVSVRYGALQEASERQLSLLLPLEAELERRLAEAAGLAQLDQVLSDQLVREEAALAARLAAEVAERAALEAATQAAIERAAIERAAAWDLVQRTEAARDAAYGPGFALTAPPPYSGTLVRVGSFTVDSSLAPGLTALLEAAAADGLEFSGGAYRSPAAQIERRRANCGPTDEDLYLKPASACRPPTARPGYSMHEQGLALDIEHGGALITSRDNPGFVWLAEHAGRFGLRNLPSEPWHWSTTGG